MGYSDEAWWERGSCRTADPEIFDGKDHRGGRPRRDGKPIRTKYPYEWDAAKALCASCPVQPACLDYILSLPDDRWADKSFAAGFTPQELAEIKRKRRSRR